MATIANHSAAGAVGAWLTTLLGPTALARAVGASFLLMGAWALVPDKLDTRDSAGPLKAGVFWTTTVLFFLVEIGDKTQVATVVLAARYESLAAVVMGTTLGMLLANVPVVMFGEAIGRRMPVATVRRIAAASFAILGVVTLVAAGR